MRSGRHALQLSLVDRTWRRAVQGTVEAIALPPGLACLAPGHQRNVPEHLPNVSRLVLEPSTLHEAMHVIPVYLMKVGSGCCGRGRHATAPPLEELGMTAPRVCMHAATSAAAPPASLPCNPATPQRVV
jgi:hypothetical protein